MLDRYQLLALFWLVLTPVACDGGFTCSARDSQPAESPSPGLSRWHYTFQLSGDLSAMDTLLCFDGRVPDRLDAQTPASRGSLVEARRVPRGNARALGEAASAGERLEQASDGIDLSGLESGDCVTYTLDLNETVRRAGDSRQVRRYGDDWVFSPDFWLWKPSGPRRDVQLSASFELPDGIRVAVPWPLRTMPDREEPVYIIPDSSFNLRVYGAIGRFTPDVIRFDNGAQVSVSILGDGWKASPALLFGWLDRAARAVAGFYGQFPVSRAQIIVTPVPGDRVSFGVVSRGGGASIRILCGTDVDAPALADDWIAVHEMLHLGVPVFEDDAAWLREGLATYYEPIVRARAGLLDQARVWATLHDGFGRGSARGSGRALWQESRDMHETRQYWRVYWAGAAIALLADVALRQAGGSLDREVRAIQDAHAGDQERVWTTDELLARVASGPVSLRSVAARHLQSSQFPDLEGAYRALGLSVDRDGNPQTSQDPGARSLREAITASR